MLNDLLYYGFRQEENTAHDKHNDILHCVLIGILIFSCAFGCITGIVSEFDLTVNMPLIAVLMFILTMFLALIHISRFLYNTGYFLFMFVFMYGLFSMRTYANSGFQAILNIVNKAYSDHYLLSSLREYTEVISDRYATLTTVCIFLGLFLVLLLNVDVFNNMYFGTAFMLTFLPIQIGIFIGRYPSYISLALLFFSYFGIYLVRHSTHFYFVQPPRRKRPREYCFEYYDNRDRFIIFHKSNARAIMGLVAAAFVISVFFGLFTASAVSSSGSESVLNKSKARIKVDETIKIVTQSGLAGLFNRYEATGGISGGKLGGVRSVSPDYETDLEITFTPYSFETIYLKGYTSSYYTGFSWEEPSERTGYRINMPKSSGPSSQTDIARDRLTSEAENTKKLMASGVFDDAFARMTIKNVDAATGYVYTPYFLSSVPDSVMTKPYSVLSGFSAVDGESTYEFIPYSSSKKDIVFNEPGFLSGIHDENDKEALSEYKEEVYLNYLQIPQNIRDELASYHDVIGTADSLQGQIDLIYKYFLNNYSYDYAPGATPYDSDFVTYFLGEQKRGYCAHFASAGTMLLRSYGFPARYVEGYVITTQAVSETAQALDEDASYYYNGNNPLGESRVIKADVTDGNAHAWTEVYVDDFGWIPVEFTVPDTGSGQPSYVDFLASLTRFFRPSDPGDDTDTAESTGQADISGTADLLNLNGTPVFVVFSLVIAVLMFIPLFRRLFIAAKEAAKRRRAYKQGDCSLFIGYCYSKAARKMARKLKVPFSGLVDDSFILIKRYLPSDKRTYKRIYSLLEKKGMTLDDIHMLTLRCFYDGQKISRPEADLLKRFYKSF